ncbi:MAG TPA: family 10 glycosylhydrolase, partial [Verrucomicrobiae bacterium]|nr:family 10 glycosylhydrolase [Verrucomicrobiae bacterium]
DPLQFAVAEAHARGLELHAWFNPYRAGFATTKYTSPKHITKTHPKWVRRYGNFLWLDPAEAGVQDHVTRVILDVMRRYDIDGVHLDDYFYPYPESVQPGIFRDFPDDPTWKRYLAAGGKLPRNEWRRENVNKLVQRLQREIRREKPWVMFGISPFGIWRPGFPPQIKGLDAYDSLYADARKWLIHGWVDYLAPQLYWPSHQREQSYPVLFDWWQRQSEKSVPIWPGGDVTKAGAWPADEIIRQIEISRKAPLPGYVHWHLSSLGNANPLATRLAATVYAEPALVPQVRPERAAHLPPSLKASELGAKQVVRWSAAPGQKISTWVLQIQQGTQWTTQILPGTTLAREIPNGSASAIAVTGVTPTRGLTPPAILKLDESTHGTSSR